MNVLIYSVEDDKDIALIINKTLTHQGYEVKSFYDGESFFKEFELRKPNIILLDMMLPDMSGTDILKKIRSVDIYKDIQILIVSAKNMLLDKVDALDLGADDYIEKPFDILELMSRVNAKVRRISNNKTIEYAGIKLDLEKRICIIDGNDITLRGKEFDILTLLVKAGGNIVTRETMFSYIWNTDVAVESRTLDMHIKSLRSKLLDKGDLIKTVYGVGYRIGLWKKD